MSPVGHKGGGERGVHTHPLAVGLELLDEVVEEVVHEVQVCIEGGVGVRHHTGGGQIDERVSHVAVQAPSVCWRERAPQGADTY